MNEPPAPVPGGGGGEVSDGGPWPLLSQQQQQQTDHSGSGLEPASVQQHQQSAFAVARNHQLYHHHHHLQQQQQQFNNKGMTNGLGSEGGTSAHYQEPESDADEEVRSLDLPAQVGIDLRSKRLGGSAEGLDDRERPMSWEGELSDQETSQMDQMEAGPPPSNQQPPPTPPSSTLLTAPVELTLKSEPIQEEDESSNSVIQPQQRLQEEQEMEGIQSNGPDSPQPMCTGGATEPDDAQLLPPPPPPALIPAVSVAVSTASTTVAPLVPPSEIKTEAPWGDCPKTDQIGFGMRPSVSAAGSTPTGPIQRPTFGEAFTGHTPLASPLTSRHPIRLPLAPSGLPHPPTPSPDSAIHSAYYSPTASPGQSRHRSGSGLSSPYSHRASPSLSRNNSDASQYSVHSQYGGSQYSYSSAPSPLSPSPAQSPVQPRHIAMLTAGGYGPPPRGAGPHGSEFPPSPLLFRHAPVPCFPGATPAGSLPGVRDLEIKSEPAHMAPPGLSANDTTDDSREGSGEEKSLNASDLAQHTASLAAQAGISRQQLINSPCPICGDKISGFHYGIFSCESCKGFFKRTVQNKKNYVCLRGAACPVTIATRKKCPACRFEKCLNTGMKLEAIREDRTRGGRSTYQCTYAVPNSGPGTPLGGMEASGNGAAGSSSGPSGGKTMLLTPNSDNGSRSMDSSDWVSSPPTAHHHHHHHHSGGGGGSNSSAQNSNGGGMNNSSVPQLLLEIMNVEHLWHSNEQEAQQHRGRTPQPHSPGSGNGDSQCSNGPTTSGGGGGESDSVSSMCSIADHRLYKIVKWCKSLPLFKNIQIDDQISLLINTWCELLLFACCFRSVATPGEIRISHGKSITLEQARTLGLGPCIERMIHFTDHLRRLRVDQFEYAAMKVIILLSSDTSGLKESESVRSSQESVLKALQQYTLSHYPDVPSKFGELLLRIPELERTCQVGKDMLTCKREGDGQGFNLLMELLRGDH